MALIKFGAFVVDMKGKVGGTIFSKNKSGAYAKNRVVPSNPQTAAQQNRRSTFASLAQGWRNLTAADREAWNELAAQMTFQNRIGDAIKISGIALYQKFNGNLQSLGLPFIDTPATLEGTTPVEVLGGSVFQLTAGVLTLAQIEAAPLGAEIASTHYAVFATAPQSPGITNLSNQYRLLTNTATLPTSMAPLDITAIYRSQFGTPPLGQKIGLRLLPINSVSGEAGVAAEFVTVVEES